MKTHRLYILGLELGIALSVLLYYYWHWGTLANFVASIDHCEYLFCDFYKAFYIMGENILTVKAPTNGFYYSPFSALLFLPYGLLPRRIALIWWGITLLIALVGLYVSWRPSMQRKYPYFKFLYLFLLLTAFPVLHNIKWGQVSIIIIFAVLLALELYQSGKWILSALWLAFAVTIKFFPVIFLLYFIAKRDLKFLLAFALFAFLLAFIIPVAFIGVHPTVAFYLEVFKNPHSRATFWVSNGDPLASTSQYFPRVVLRLLGGTIPQFWLLAIQAASLLFLGANMFLTMLVSNSTLPNRIPWSFLFIFASTPFIVPTSWAHYFVYLPAFQAWMVFALNRDAGGLLKLKYALLILSIVLSNSLFYISFDTRQLYAFGGYLLWSNCALLITAYIDLIPQINFSHVLNTLHTWLPGLASPQRKPR